MNRRSFLKFAGLAPVVPMVAVEVLSSAPVVFDPNCLVGTTKFVSPGRFAATVTMWEESKTSPSEDIIETMKILEGMNCNKPRQLILSSGEWKKIKALERYS